MKGLVTQIQRFSLQDGPGIRTTVFLKGCNMRCDWCHNPETLSFEKELMFYENKCIGCGQCFQVCPTGAQKAENGRHIIDRTLCGRCGRCAEECFAGALVLCGQSMDTEEVMREILQDKAYYETSGGGVTISGGEVLCQKTFAGEILSACRNEGIATAVETNLSLPFDEIKDFLLQLDLVMCDLKLWEEKAHVEHTGISNRQILKNIRRLDETGMPFLVRTPLIPGVTDNPENIASIAAFLAPFSHLQYYELLNFNPLGAAKYQELHRYNPYENAAPLDAERLSALKRAGEQAGIRIKIS